MPEKFSFLKKPFLLLLVPLAIYFYFGFQHIAKFETADEHYWIYSNSTTANYWGYDNGRIEQYWNGILTGNLKLTRINDKPGVTLAFVSGIGSYLQTRLDQKIATGVIAPMGKTEKAELINYFFRIPILVFNGLFVFVLYFLLKKLTGSSLTALLASTLMLLSPVLVGISQIVNPDSLLWSLGFAALLSYLVFLNEGTKKYVFWSVFFMGLSLLTKYTSVILLPFFLLIMGAYFVRQLPSFEKEKIKSVVVRYAWAYIIIAFGALAIYAVLMPDNLIEFRNFLKGSVGFKGTGAFFGALLGINVLILIDAYFNKNAFLLEITNGLKNAEKYVRYVIFALLSLILFIVIGNTIFGKDLLDLFAIPFDATAKHFFASNPLDILLRQFLPLIFSLSPLVLLAVAYAWIKNIRRNTQQSWIILVFSLFIAVFVAAVTQQKVPLTIRYSIMLYPIMFTIAAIAIVQIFDLEKKSLKLKVAVFGALIVISLPSLWQSKPFYFNYTNMLLPKNYLIADAWGYGGYEAAQYLNSLPGAKDMRIWSDYNGVCLFFEGKCSANEVTMEGIQKNAPQQPDFDYFVSDRRGADTSIDLWENLKQQYGSKQIWNLEIGGRPANFVKIYANK